MKIKRNLISIAIKKALYSGLILSVVLTNVSQAEEEEKVEKLDTIQVTGSRIKRSDTEESLPITTITREQIELSGETNAADLLRSMTFNSSGSFRTQSGSTAQGVSSISLRGIGANRTLVLVNGRRLPKTPLTGSSQDLNTIPLAAIEKIEVLTDGASAIYGSDAIGGVVNIITRTDFNGVEVMLGVTDVSLPNDGGGREQGHVLFGSSNETTSIIGGVSWNDREIIFERDYDFTVSGSSTFSNNFRNVNASGGEVRTDIPVLGGCDFPGRAFFLLDSNGRCAYDFTQVSAEETSLENKSLFLKVKHDINDKWQLWSNVSVNKTESFGRYAPVPDGSSFSGSGLPLSIDSINNPSNPVSPNYDPANFPDRVAVHWRHRFDALGNRDTTVSTELTSFELGTTGQVGKTEVEFGVLRNRNRTSNIGRNFLLRSAAAEAIEDGTYLLQDPFASSDSVLNSLRVTTTREGVYDEDAIFASVAMDVFNLPHGPISTYFGVEHREIEFADIYDSLSEAGQVGGSSGSNAAGSREVNSAFFEALVYLTEDLEMNLAGRFDDYSDFGNEFSPKISFRYQPWDNLTLRASWGEGFRAPNLVTLTQQPADSADSVDDPQTCIAEGSAPNCSTQIRGRVIANPNLAAEESTQFAFGFAYEPFDWFNVTLDYFNIEIDNQIRNFSAQALVDFDLAGDPGVSGLGVTRDPDTGAITLIVRGAANRGLLSTSGLDLNARFNYDALGGRFDHNLQWSHILTNSLDNGRDRVEDPGSPADRLVISNTYSTGRWSFAYNLNLIGEQYDDVDEIFVDGNAVSGEGVGHVPTWVTHDVQLNYQTAWNAKFTLGVRNIGEKIPPLELGSLNGRAYDFSLYDAYGRITYLRYTQTF